MLWCFMLDLEGFLGDIWLGLGAIVWFEVVSGALVVDS